MRLYLNLEEILVFFRKKAEQITISQLIHTLQQVGIKDIPVCLHSSLRSFGRPLEKGPHGILEAFRATGCTLMVPTFSFAYLVLPPDRLTYPQNGLYAHFPPVKPRPEGFSQESSYLDQEQMGIIPAALLQEKDHFRGFHPLCSFSAIGPLAKTIVQGQAPLNIYDPFQKLCEMDGIILMMGVDLTRCTFIHYAEKLAGINLMRRWAKLSSGTIIESENGSCSSGFNRLFPIVQSICRVIRVGSSRWLIFPAKEFLHLTTQAIQKDRMIRHCGYPDCKNCEDITRGGPILNQRTIPIHSILTH